MKIYGVNEQFDRYLMNAQKNGYRFEYTRRMISWWASEHQFCKQPVIELRYRRAILSNLRSNFNIIRGFSRNRI